jgi:hypothetical protein
MHDRSDLAAPGFTYRPPIRSPVRLLAALTAAIALLALGPAASAAGRKVPRGFWGANWDGQLMLTGSPANQTLNWDRMATSGVESARATFLWSAAQPDRGGEFNFGASDSPVILASAHGIDLLPTVAYAPAWARGAEFNSPPTNPSEYAAYLRALVGRYGPNGSFWAERPDLPKRPIRTWQIWNEPSANYQWTIPKGQDWAPGYGALLRAAYPAIKQADPGARVVLAGLPSHSYQDLEHLYKVGDIHGSFDIAAVHPFSSHSHGPLTIVKRFRAVMKKHGDGNKPLLVTELGLPATKGRTTGLKGLATDDAGMAKVLKESYTDLMANRAKLRVPRVYWYTWASSYTGDWAFDYSGLFRYPDANGQQTAVAKPAFAVYRKLARQAEGCKKNTLAACVPGTH